MTCSYVTGSPGHYQCSTNDRSKCPKGCRVCALRVTAACFTIPDEDRCQNSNTTLLQRGAP
jgi:hypothetical protein